ncbi:histidine phosphatase family protein [Nocardioides sp.]|uniref:SixA phosphatase family protein n=1 Tax=Nocardioides sp. TaxID=35761 RepID=UPI001A2CEB40|nr:histidine phosphatase family protein [Nocardioides sp.]MBJ7355834.1 histidine phosphatase family protein [Nocardioides sp.]
MRTIVVMRHAKAEQTGATDYERRLAERGRADAAEAGRWLAARGVEPELALVSAAVRTQETWDSLVEGAGWDLDPELDEGLYSAGTQAALDLLREVDDGITSVILVGHNPTVASLATILDDGEGDEEAGNELALGYPTSAVTVFEYDGRWSELDEASASVVAFHVGRA